jgi:hypothetical protein
MCEISSIKNNRERKNKLEVSQESLCSESLLPIATILNPTCKVEEWVDFKTMLVANFTRLVHIGFFKSIVHVLFQKYSSSDIMMTSNYLG